MKEVITNTWCDAHKARDVSEEVHGLTMTLAIDDEGPQTLDLCAECITEFVDPLKKLLATFGQPVEVTPAPKKRRRQSGAAAPAPAAPATPAAPEKSTSASNSTSSSTSKPAKKAASKGKSGKAKTATPAEIRAWAVDQGLQIPAVGRIPQDVREAFEASGGKAPAKAS